MSVMDNERGPVVVQAAGPYLPAPRVPVNRRHPAAAEAARVMGEALAAPLVELEGAYAAAREAVAALETNRPGGMGHGWRQALEDDARAYGTDTKPKKWKTAQLLEGDPARWAHATAACSDLAAAVRRCEGQLDKREIGSVARLVMDAKGGQWAKAAEEGWQSRRDEVAAWQHYRRGEDLLGEYGTAHAVRVWSGWAAPDPGKVTTAHGLVSHLQSEVPPIVHTLPDDPAARGQWLCLELVLRPVTRWLWLPPTPAVQWPDDTQEMRERAVGENIERFKALRSRGTTRRSGDGPAGLRQAPGPAAARLA